MTESWQPAFPQAMQRHGGRTRPLVPASARPVVTPSHDSATAKTDDDQAGEAGETARSRNRKPKNSYFGAPGTAIILRRSRMFMVWPLDIMMSPGR